LLSTIMSTSLKRVYSIPLVADSISTLHESLSSNGLTRSPYSLGLAVGEKALNLSQPIQDRLAPVINRADGLANKGLDAVESRYPYPFQTPSQEIYRDIKAYPDHAVDAAQRAAHSVAHDIDQRLTPLVNRYETAIGRISSRQSGSKTPSENSEGSQEPFTREARSQVERAYKLTLDLRNQIYTLSSEQLAHHQILAAAIQRITEVVYDINTQITASYLNVKGKGIQLKDTTQAHVHQVGQNIMHQLDKIQATAKALPAHVQANIQPIQERLQQTLSSLAAILKSDSPMSDKATQVRQTVQKEVQPLLSTVLDAAHNYAEASRKLMGRQQHNVESKVSSTKEHANDKVDEAKRSVNGNVKRTDSQDSADKPMD